MPASRSEKVTFIGADGESQLAARLDRPESKPHAYALFAHCFTCSQNVFAASRIAAELTAHGFGVLRFDFTGLGASEGEFANTNFSSNIGDLLAAVAWLRQTHEAPKLLIGHSLGGTAVLAAATEVPEAAAIATIAAPADPVHITRLLQPAIAEIEQRGEAEVLLAGRPFRIKRQFLDDIEGHRLGETIAHLSRALLILHAPGDEIVGIDNATRIFTAARHSKSFVSLDGADHLLSRREDAVYAADVIAAWAGRYLPQQQATPVAHPAVVAPEGAVTVAEAGTGGFAQVVSVGGRHLLTADEPLSYGGTDTGPSPYDYLLVALGACTAMTVRMYAQHKQLPLQRVAVTLRHAKIHATDCADCETKDGKIDRIEREIELVGLLDAPTRAKLLEIADKCPVHRTLHSEVSIVTRAKS